MNDFEETGILKYGLDCATDVNLITVQVKVLHHLACVELTLEI
jgi:hypothetical protein